MTAWTAPITWASGSVLTAAQLNTEVRDHATLLKGALDLITNSTTADTGSATYLQITRASQADPALRLFATGDTVPELMIAADGGCAWSSGSASADVALARTTAGRLSVSGTNAQLGVLQGVGGTDRNQLYTWLTGDTNPRISLGLTAADKPRIAWGPGDATPDLYLTRDQAGRLVASATSDSARVGSYVLTGEAAAFFAWRSGDTTPRVSIGQEASGLPALRFSSGAGAPYETIWRHAAGDVRTDAHFYAAELAVPVLAGVPDDGDTAVDMSGNVVLDTTNSRIYFRVGTTWKYAALT